MKITAEQLKKIMPYAAKANLEKYLDPLNAAMEEFGIDTPKRAAAFLAQVTHESGSLKYSRELASGKAYENRPSMGNINPGDGPKYKGGGPLQLTWANNYKQCGDEIGIDLYNNPELIEHPGVGCRAAGWFWKGHNLNHYVDMNQFDNVSHVINGGWNGRQERQDNYARALKVLMG